MTPEEIRLEIFKRRKTINQSKIARALGVTPAAVMCVIDRRFVSNRIMAAIAEAIGKDKTDVFPEYFNKKASA